MTTETRCLIFHSFSLSSQALIHPPLGVYCIRNISGLYFLSLNLLTSVVPSVYCSRSCTLYDMLGLELKLGARGSKQHLSAQVKNVVYLVIVDSPFSHHLFGAPVSGQGDPCLQGRRNLASCSKLELL